MSDELVKRLLGTKSMKIMLDRIEALEAENADLSEACAKWAEVSQGNYRRAKDAEAERDGLRAALAKADELAQACDALHIQAHKSMTGGHGHLIDDAARTLAAYIEARKSSLDA